MPQNCRYSFWLILYDDLRRDYCILPSFCSIKPNISPTLNASPAYIYILLTLWRFKKAILVLQSVRTSFYIKVISYVRASISLANYLTVWKTLIGEFSWCLIIRFCTKSDCDIASTGLYSVWKIYRLTLGRKRPIGINVCSLISNFDIIAWRSYGIKPAFRKLVLMFSDVIMLK